MYKVKLDYDGDDDYLFYDINSDHYLIFIYDNEQYISLEKWNHYCSSLDLLLAFMNSSNIDISDDNEVVIRHEIMSEMVIPIKLYDVEPKYRLKPCDSHCETADFIDNGIAYKLFIYNHDTNKILINILSSDNKYYCRYFTNKDISKITGFWKMNVNGLCAIIENSKFGFKDNTLYIHYYYFIDSDEYSEFKFELSIQPPIHDVDGKIEYLPPHLHSETISSFSMYFIGNKYKKLLNFLGFKLLKCDKLPVDVRETILSKYFKSHRPIIKLELTYDMINYITIYANTLDQFKEAIKDTNYIDGKVYFCRYNTICEMSKFLKLENNDKYVVASLNDVRDFFLENGELVKSATKT
jgi:hypothetical protein